MLCIAYNSCIIVSVERDRNWVRKIERCLRGGYTLIRERYSEIYKAEAQGKVNELIESFSRRFSNEEKLQRVILIYEKCLEIGPEIVGNPSPRETETDKMAEFSLKENTVRLYLQKTGKWGFHM